MVFPQPTARDMGEAKRRMRELIEKEARREARAEIEKERARAKGKKPRKPAQKEIDRREFFRLLSGRKRR